MAEPVIIAQTDICRADVDALCGAALLEFGASWCGFCLQARSVIDAAVAAHPRLKHIKIEDGPGQPLGRSFGVKRWPTVIFLQEGKEVARVVRPANLQDVIDAQQKIKL